MVTDQSPSSPNNAGPYSRAATVAALRSFYDFLATLPRLPASAILDAPASGWPALTDSSLARLGPKTDAVRDLLRHVPAIAATEGDAKVQADSPGYWRVFRTRPVADFFKEWVEKYRSLERFATSTATTAGLTTSVEKTIGRHWQSGRQGSSITIAYENAK
ncbi:hypothetical protein VP1G_00820 [Cytospora mali]|uniref:Uncharacterized protein n=1 Tax=Cytospora mali TaxID=578113 RepID=A0A194UNV8_CYTMA|nr:hypothetical protein VP1G_00820 [Valsa mali var. pyri (nom. inval.)]